MAPAMADEQLVEGRGAEVGNEQAEFYPVAYFDVGCTSDKMLRVFYTTDGFVHSLTAIAAGDDDGGGEKHTGGLENGGAANSQINQALCIRDVLWVLAEV